MNVYLSGTRIALDPAAAIGQGGEAEVYEYGGRALKVFKSPTHPDFAGLPQAQDGARERIALHQRKLPDFPAGLPARVIAPETLARSRKRGGTIVGYSMPLVRGAQSLGRLAEPKLRRQAVSGNDVVAALRELHDTVTALHRLGVVIGDFNDENVLVRGHEAYLIDADSFQYGGYPCAVFTERFVDPLLCDPQAAAPRLCQPYGPDSDWYAFHVLAMRALLCVGPYGGVHRPKDAARRVPHAARPLRRVTVFDPEVIYPKPALPYALLPDDLVEHLRAVFCRDQRGPLPRDLLDDLRWTRCRRCGVEHARSVCPGCRPGAAHHKRIYARVRGQVRVDEIFATAGAVVAAAVAGKALVWLSLDAGELANHRGEILATGLSLRPGRRIECLGDGALVIEAGRARALGPASGRSRASVNSSPTAAGSDGANDYVADVCGPHTALCADADGQVVWASGGQLLARHGRQPAYAGALTLGAVLAGQTRLWLGDGRGFGLYRAGALTVGFTFSPQRRGLDDRVELPPLRGRISHLHAAVARDRVWLFWRERRGAKEAARCALFGPAGELLADAEAELGAAADAAPWLLAGPGCTAVGPYLFAPTDAGVARVEQSGDRLAATRLFPDTAPFVSADDRLLVGPDGLYVISSQRIVRLQLT
ncbi:hypothetical protein [Haliangium sp.]|uniref:hypothetical protein n=1 Tax=Haliangium sp. TaxID=2663208 RepID=UPI003D103591